MNLAWLRDLLLGPPVPRVEGARARQLVDEGAVLLDVRTFVEFRTSGALPGSVNIPVRDLPARLDELPDDYPIVVYCLTGSRSYRAAQVLIKAGFPEVYDLGRFRDW